MLREEFFCAPSPTTQGDPRKSFGLIGPNPLYSEGREMATKLGKGKGVTKGRLTNCPKDPAPAKSQVRVSGSLGPHLDFSLSSPTKAGRSLVLARPRGTWWGVFGAIYIPLLLPSTTGPLHMLSL